jgi:hypothetical protein
MKPKYIYIYSPGSLRVEYEGKCLGGFVGEIADRKFTELLDTGVEIKIGSMDKNQKTAKLRALWMRQGIDDLRTDILAPYGVTSTADLTESQVDELIGQFTQKTDTCPEIRAHRSVILKLLTEIGVYSNGNWPRVNQYMMDKRIAGKLLYQMSIPEMKELTKKLRSIRAKYLNMRAIEGRLALNN